MKHFKAKDDSPIDGLTNSLLVLIINFLSFKEAARTCILSKQWVNIWRETTNIEFNENFFVKSGGSKENQTIQRSKFIDFVRQFIVNYPKKDIQKFSLVFSNPQDFISNVKTFVVFAISHNVRELEIDFSNPLWREGQLESLPSYFELPLEFYQLKAMVSLKLFSCCFDASKFNDFRVLKSVCLGWIEISIDSIKRILINCPLIDSISLKYCNLDHFYIYLPNSRLKILILDKCNFSRDGFWIEGPKLQFLKYSGRIDHFYLSNPNIVEADLDFGLESEFDEVGSLLYDFLQDIYKVKVLTLCSVFLQIIPQGEEPIGSQSPLHVQNLTLKTAMHPNEYFGIRFMLNSCPLLEILTFDIGPAKLFTDYEPPFRFVPHEFWSKDLIIQKCMKRSLKVVNVKGFKGTASELFLLTYRIHFGSQLKELNIYISNEDGGHAENRQTFKARDEFLLNVSKPRPQLQASIFL